MSSSPSLDLEQLFHEHHHDLLAMLRCMVGCPATAADLAQEAYVRLADASPSRDIISPRAFLLRIAKNLALDHFWKQKFRGDRQTSIEEAADTRGAGSAMSGLSARTRSVFVLRRVYGYSYPEIAAQNGNV